MSSLLLLAGSKTSKLLFIHDTGCLFDLVRPKHATRTTMARCEWQRGCRDIPQPLVASLYFSDNNVIDVHNHTRQGTLALEKKWQTQDCWFRLFATLVGMCAIDGLKIFMYVKPRLEDGKKKTITFAALFANQFMDNKWENGE